MRIGFVMQNQGPGCVAQTSTLAPALEAMGFASLWATDHVVGVRAFEPHGYGAFWLEALTSLAFMAGQTKTIRLGPSVLVAPIRDPVYTAKALATIDQLSGGRLSVAVGTGWSKAEFHALGRGDDHEARGKVTDETLELMLRCWQGGTVDWAGERFTVRRAEFEPRPRQQPHPPLLIGGPFAPPVMRRVKRFGDAWHPSTRDIVQLKADMERMNDFAERAVPVVNRLTFPEPPDDLELTRLIAGCAELGCVETVVDLRPLTADAAMAAAERILHAYRTAA